MKKQNMDSKQMLFEMMNKVGGMPSGSWEYINKTDKERAKIDGDVEGEFEGFYRRVLVPSGYKIERLGDDVLYSKFEVLSRAFNDFIRSFETRNREVWGQDYGYGKSDPDYLPRD